MELRYFEKNGEPLFSSHMLDLSEESLEDNISICKEYLERMAKINLLLEMELGVTGGEEDALSLQTTQVFVHPQSPNIDDFRMMKHTGMSMVLSNWVITRI